MRFYELDPKHRLYETGDLKEEFYAAIAPTWRPYDDSSRPRLTLRKLRAMRRQRDKNTIADIEHKQLIRQMYGLDNCESPKQRDRHDLLNGTRDAG
ncbi:hypothetical protein [Pseudoalteromonas sp. BDTF-M6]|uniref:hypothetical protein n=1 Tax=Pseudoalteromonas sp. BDTF-M6 TaxID=2796132 RepID=UPI001BAF7D37|nr:hypothetical protein [Pseudoalteromonas sp. BDTF-M6]MBS3798117.1 hypothetical protein [Pseudoalteromonas sp. BDTF-M6]